MRDLMNTTRAETMRDAKMEATTTELDLTKIQPVATMQQREAPTRGEV